MMQALLGRLVQLLPNLTGAMGRLAPALQGFVNNFSHIISAVGAVPGAAANLAVQAAGAAGVGPAAGAGIAEVVGAISGLAAPVVGAVVAFVALTAATVVFGKALLEANRGLAEFSPSMAAVFAQSDVRTMQREMKQGEEQAGAASYLAEALADLQDTLQPIITLLTNILSVIVGVLAKVLDVILTPLAAIAEAVNKILAWLFKSDTEKQFINVGQWMDRVREDARKGQARDDPGFRRPDLPRDPYPLAGF